MTREATGDASSMNIRSMLLRSVVSRQRGMNTPISLSSEITTSRTRTIGNNRAIRFAAKCGLAIVLAAEPLSGKG